MKIGLFIVGFLRDAPITKENFSQFLDDSHDLSVYIGSWANYDINRQTHKLESQFVDVKTPMENVFGKKIKGLFVGDAVKFYNNEPPDEYRPARILTSQIIKEEDCSDEIKKYNSYPYLQRVLDQAYVWKHTYLLSEPEFDSFDVCIKVRGDMNFIGKPRIPFYEIQDGIHFGSHWWKDKGNDTTTLDVYQVSDQLAWGNPKWMKKYFSYYDYLPSLFQFLKYPHSVFESTCEHILAYYLQCPTDEFDSVKLHKHGYPEMIKHHTTTGISEYDYYNLMTKGIR